MTSADKPEPIQKCFESLEYIFKLIIQSRKLFARATGGQFEDSFRRDLFTVFQSLNQLLTITSYDKILPSQEALLSNLNVALEQLKNVIAYSEVGTLATNMLDSVPLLDAEPRLIVAKLQAVKALVSGELFHDEGTFSVGKNL
jgi:dedicator of cytokinesis protein 3